jgi:hypothetical protein
MSGLASACHKAWPVQKPEKRKGEQAADDQGQPGKKPDLFLVLRQNRFSPADDAI